VSVLSDAPERFAPGSVVTTRKGPLTIATSRPYRDGVIVSFEGITDRNASDALRGSDLTIPDDSARPLESDEYWDHDLIGCEVVTVDGDVVGDVTDVLHQPAGELLEVGKHLIPLIRDIVKSVEPGVRITIDPLPGLLD
jgi:16S rRNA processing protein RimM